MYFNFSTNAKNSTRLYPNLTVFLTIFFRLPSHDWVHIHDSVSKWLRNILQLILNWIWLLNLKSYLINLYIYSHPLLSVFLFLCLRIQNTKTLGSSKYSFGKKKKVLKINFHISIKRLILHFSNEKQNQKSIEEMKSSKTATNYR